MRLREMHDTKNRLALSKELGVNVMTLPRIAKATVNVGLSKYMDNKEAMERIKAEMSQVLGQAPKTTISKKSVSGFKLRQGQVVGYSLTLRGKRMWDFIERLTKVSLPRIRDFDGIDSRSFDKSGNFTLGVVDQTIFTEIKPDEIKESWGMSVSFTVKNGQNGEMSRDYLKSLGFVFK